MPLELFETGENRAWAIWRIEETEAELKKLVTLDEGVPETLTHPQKRLEWFAGRHLTQALLDNFRVHYAGIAKDEWGKPFIKNSDMHISLTHSYPFVGAIADKSGVVGIDLEQPKEKLLRIAPRVLAGQELLDAGNDIIKHCIYWCSKETLIKIYGKKDLSLANNLRIEPFKRGSEGNIIGRIIVNQEERIIPLYYKIFKQFVVVFNQQEGLS